MSGGSISIFFTRPISAILIGLAVFSALAILSRRRRSKSR
jgi:uncharacterized protein (TIGR03382 family)